jgi:hypothetical protein
VLLLAGCGGLPRPFAGNPGANGRQLSQPPPARLAIAPPTEALLPNLGADTLAGALADALVAKEVPAVVETPRKGDWSIAISAEVHGGNVVPNYEVIGPDGKSKGSTQGAPVPAQTWADGQPTVLRGAATSAAPAITTLLTSIDAQMRRSDPNSLLNRPARVVVTPVTGAPGDGNAQLTKLMRNELPKLGVDVQDSTENADFTVTAKVATAPAPKGQTRVEIQWLVMDAKGNERGHILQLNDVPPGTVDGLWGDVAVVVVQEAAGGVHDVITTVAQNR